MHLGHYFSKSLTLCWVLDSNPTPSMFAMHARLVFVLPRCCSSYSQLESLGASLCFHGLFVLAIWVAPALLPNPFSIHICRVYMHTSLCICLFCIMWRFVAFPLKLSRSHCNHVRMGGCFHHTIRRRTCLGWYIHFSNNRPISCRVLTYCKQLWDKLAPTVP